MNERRAEGLEQRANAIRHVADNAPRGALRSVQQLTSDIGQKNFGLMNIGQKTSDCHVQKLPQNRPAHFAPQ